MSTTPLSVSGIVIGDTPLAFDVQPGEILAVLGDNGSGKSLLLAHLSGHLRAQNGSVHVGGRDLFHHKQRRAAQAEIGVVFQHSGLIRNMTVFENVALPFLVHGLDLDGGLDEQVRLRLGLVGCAHLAHEEVHRLSEGDKRCVALARALSGHTRVLIADEPAAALAPAKKALVEELLASLVQGGVLTGIVLATQDLDFARRIATRFLLLHHGGHTLVSREAAERDEHFQAFTRKAA
ncbi:MAG: ATP-binding cassette domain-containing protein [Verrucomicrobia bacterium]|nr:ATP-binding cassette domain-containing protein [Verrucomicrobiota bacterium]